jgi:PHD/YefM family antitoxin component YafN of YafNO toxin-antitoxin module
MKITHISIEEFRCNLERCFADSRNQTLIVSSASGEEIVVMSAAEFEKLRQPDDVVAMAVDALSPAQLAALDRSEIPQEARDLDHLLPDGWPENR